MNTSHLQSMLARNAATITYALQQAYLEKQTARFIKRTLSAIKKELRHQVPYVDVVS